MVLSAIFEVLDNSVSKVSNFEILSTENPKLTETNTKLFCEFLFSMSSIDFFIAIAALGSK